MTFDQIMMRFASPTMCGIKPANLFSIKAGRFSEAAISDWRRVLEKSGIFLFCVPLKKGAAAVLVYKREWAEEILRSDSVQAYLEKKGYPKGASCAPFVAELRRRMQADGAFPHEVGILLGYPVSDVMEFEARGGKGFCFCGSWKAYSNAARAKEAFFEWQACGDLCEKWFGQGYTLGQIIKKYKAAKSAA